MNIVAHDKTLRIRNGHGLLSHTTHLLPKLKQAVDKSLHQHSQIDTVDLPSQATPSNCASSATKLEICSVPTE